jgi:hypothetical protein
MAKKSSSARVAVPGSHKDAPRGAKLAGKIAPEERLEVTVRLRRKPGAGTPKVGGKPLTRDQFRDAYGADPADIEKIGELRTSTGSTSCRATSRSAVRLSGTTAAMRGLRRALQAVPGDEDEADVPRPAGATAPRQIVSIIRGFSASTIDRRPDLTSALPEEEGMSATPAPRSRDAAAGREALLGNPAQGHIATPEPAEAIARRSEGLLPRASASGSRRWWGLSGRGGNDPAARQRREQRGCRHRGGAVANREDRGHCRIRTRVFSARSTPRSTTKCASRRSSDQLGRRRRVDRQAMSTSTAPARRRGDGHHGDPASAGDGAPTRRSVREARGRRLPGVEAERACVGGTRPSATR